MAILSREARSSVPCTRPVSASTPPTFSYSLPCLCLAIVGREGCRQTCPGHPCHSLDLVFARLQAPTSTYASSGQMERRASTWPRPRRKVGSKYPKASTEGYRDKCAGEEGVGSHSLNTTSFRRESNRVTVKAVSTRTSPRCIKCAGEEGGRTRSLSQTRVERVEQSQFEIVFTRISPHPTPLPCETSVGPVTETYVYFLPQNVPRRAPVARGVANAVIVADHFPESNTSWQLHCFTALSKPKARREICVTQWSSLASAMLRQRGKHRRQRTT